MGKLHACPAIDRKKIKDSTIVVFGDFCLDAYWEIDADENEKSVETGLPVRKVRNQKYSPGGAANVVVNLAAMGVGRILAVGVVGDDLYGGLMGRMLEEAGVDTATLLRGPEDWQTLVFGKPMIEGVEQSRMDFGGFNVLSGELPGRLEQALDEVASKADIVILNQQIPSGISTPEMIERINRVIERHPDCLFLVDSRHRADLYRGGVLKINVYEAARVLGEEREPGERIATPDARRMALALYERTGKTAFVTRGENGLVWADASGVQDVPGIQIVERTDPVGAGDTSVAALAVALGAGADVPSAAVFANMASSVVTRKIQTTGTASLDEIEKLGPVPDYIYNPELAEDIRHAQYVGNSEIEVIGTLPETINIRHAIFDHDGTISTLRQGWEDVMEPMMVKAILGPRYDDADETLYHKVVDASRRFIDRTTGIQTLVQMQGLIELVRQFGCVSEEEILDMHGYKAIYNEALLDMVKQRVAKLERGELAPEDFQMKNARPFLEALHAQGVTLYLASGTDEVDVIEEAEALGYAHLFKGGIFGATGDINVEAKRVVLERIIRENGLSGSEFATFGDGPVEMRECCKRGGVAIGIASDEVQRFGLNAVKRTRVVRAGAGLVIPDFSQMEQLLTLLQL